MNKVLLLGRFTKDPELRFTKNKQTPVCKFTLAANKRFQKQGEERKADFIICIAWNKIAEHIAKYYKKGSQATVVGRIETRTWKDNEGKNHYSTEVIIEEIYFADSKKSDEQTTGGQDNVEFDGSYGLLDEDDELPF